jgi:hypothetical protein
MADYEVRVRSWVRASDDDIRTGLLGFLSLTYGSFVFDSICLRRSATGKLILSFPQKTDRAGRKHAFVRPADDAARQAVEREVLRQLGQHPEAAEVADG